MKIIIILFLLVSFGGCNKVEKVYTPRENTKYRYNEIKDVKKIEVLPVNPKTGLYQKEEFGVAVLLPLTGDKKNIGQQVLDAITMATQDLNVDNIKLFVFDTGSDPVKTKIAARQAISINAKVVIGPVFSDETKIVKEILEPLGIPIISLSNNTELASAKTYIFGVSPDTLNRAAYQYLSQIDHKNVGLLLSSTKSGFLLGKYLNKVADSMFVNIMSTQYYTPGSQESIESAVHKLSTSKKLKYLIDENGREYLQKVNIKNDKKEMQNLKTKINTMNVIFLDTIGQDLYQSVAEIKRKDLWSEDMLIVSSQNIIEDSTILQNPMSDGLIFINTSAPYIYEFGNSFENLFNYKPSRLAAIAYDAFSTIASIVANYNGNMSILLNPEGFSGIYGDFRFVYNGNVQRKFYVQKINKKTIDLIEKIDKFM